MAENTTLHTDKQYEYLRGGDFDFMPSETHKIRVGCGNLYVTICYDEKRRFKRLFIPRNSKFRCDLITRDGLARTATFGGKRNLKQTIRDLRGSLAHHCDNYNITCEASSCFDGVSKILERWQKMKKKKKQQPKHQPNYQLDAIGECFKKDEVKKGKITFSENRDIGIMHELGELGKW